MITVTEQPPGIAAFTDEHVQPVALTDCLRWCLQPDAADAVSTPGAKATVVVSFPATTTVPADGTPFKIWGYDFEIDSASEFTATSFKAYTSGLFTALNYIQMLQANVFFNRAMTTSVAVVSGAFEVTATWNECREQPSFTEADMDFSGVEATGATATATNGTSPVYTEGYQVISRVGVYQDASAFLPITPLEGFTADALCDSVGELCIDYGKVIASQLFTRLPDLTSTSFITSIENGRSMMRNFNIEYGWVYRENCQPVSGTISKADIVTVINAAFGLKEPYGMRRYWYNHPDGFPPGQSIQEYLTTQPKVTRLCYESFAWLWLTQNFRDTFGSHYLRARFVLYKKGVAGPFEFFEDVVMSPATDGSSWYQPVNFNVSPQFVYDNAPTLTQSTLDYYEVQVIGTDISGEDVYFNATEYLTFVPEHCCDGETDLYILTPPGGIATQKVTIQKVETVTTATEADFGNACNLARTERAKYGGRTQKNRRAYEQVSIEISLDRNEDSYRWLRDISASPQLWLRMPDNFGDPMALKFLPNPASFTTNENGAGVIFAMSGILQDIATQKGYEPNS